MTYARPFLAPVVLVAALGATSCKKRDPSDHAREERLGIGQESYLARELDGLKAALAARDFTKISIGCLSATAGIERLPARIAREIEPLCYVEAPRIELELAIAATRKQLAETAGQGVPDDVQRSLACAQLPAWDALGVLAKHPPSDPTVRQRVAELAQLCPEEVETRLGSGKPAGR